MRRFLLCWLALTGVVVVGLSLPASRANMVQMPLGGAPPAYTGPIDVLTSPPTVLACYSVRPCSSALGTSGVNVVQLARSADTNNCYIKATSTGALSTTVSGCTVGADNGSTVTLWCGQSSGSCTAAFQNQIGAWGTVVGVVGGATHVPAYLINSGCSSGTLPCLNFVNNNSSTWMAVKVTTVTDSAQPFSISMVASGNSNGGKAFSVINQYGSSAMLILDNTTGKNQFLISTDGSTVLATAVGSMTAGSWYAIAAFFNGATSVINVNGTETSGPAGVGTKTLLDTGTYYCIGMITCDGGAWAQGLNAKVSEIIIFAASGLTGPNRTALVNNQRAYFGF
jgi:hypothetical protein